MYNILIIDDIEPNLRLLTITAEKIKNIKVHPFLNPLDAVEWCKKNEPDLILVDYLMPEMNGIDFTIYIREELNYKYIPIIMITAFDDREIKHKALNSGVNDFINKPIDIKEISAKIQNFLKIREYDYYLQDRNKWLKKKVEKATRDLKEREEELIHRLVSMAEYREKDTGYHIKRVAYYSKIIAEELGLDEEEVELIFLAAPMHDIGKVGISDSILLKPGKLTKEEFEIIKTHTIIGYNILKDSKSNLIQKGAIIALRHHEKWDGTGYPDGLKENKIPLEGQIVAVADVFDALTSKRPYKEAWAFEKAVEYISQSKGTHFSPHCSEAFLKRIKDIKNIYDKFN